MKFLVQREGLPVRMSEERFYLVLLSVLAALTAGIVTYFALILHRNFLTIACDTAAFQNTVVNTLHGHWFRDTAYDGPNLLGVHASLVLLLIVPIYVLAPSVDTLFILQICSVYSTVIPLYLVAGEILKRPLTAFLVAASGLASPFLMHMALAPFHPETWITAAVLWSYYCYRRNQEIGFWTALTIALISGEESIFIYLALGFMLFVREDGIAWRQKYGIAMVAVSLIWLVLSVGVISPLMHTPEQQNLLAHHYEQWNVTSIWGLVLAFAENPLATLTTLFSPLRWTHLAMLIGLPLILILCSWDSLILFAPLPVYLLLCDREFYLYFHAYYYSFAFLAGYLGVLLFLGRRDLGDRFGIVILAGMFFFNILLLCDTASFYIQYERGRDDAFSTTLHEVFAKIPPEATVYTPHRYSAYLSNRENMVIGDLRDEHLDFKAMMDARFEETNVRPEQVNYIVCDYMIDQCGWREGDYDSDTTRRRMDNINRLLQSGQWKIFWNQNNVVILQRKVK